ncbi:hypothetical protein Bca4012_046909 [Brassica carinata]
METLHPLLSHVPTSDHRFVVQEMMCLQTSIWTKEENKKFERALAIYADDTPDRWFKVAAMIPGKTISDVMTINIAQKQSVQPAQYHQRKPIFEPIPKENRDKETVAVSARNQVQRCSSKSTERELLQLHNTYALLTVDTC